MKRQKGAMTVEAAIVLPIYILLMSFILNFLNIFYLKTVIQSGLNNVGITMSQYCYIIDLTLDGGMSNFTLSDSTSAKAASLENGVNNFTDAAGRTMAVFDQSISAEMLVQLINEGKNFVEAADNLKKTLMSIKGEDVKNYLLTTAAETGGSMLVEALVEKYIDDMHVNRSLIDGDIVYEMYITNDDHHDLIFVAKYQYSNRIFSALYKKPFYIEQQVAVHPWIGGSTDGLR